jgi:hypothetical protein
MIVSGSFILGHYTRPTAGISRVLDTTIISSQPRHKNLREKKNILTTYYRCFWGRDIAQAISSPLPTAAARVRAQVRSYEICSGQNGTEEGFLRALRFPLPIFIPPIPPQSPSLIIWGWYNRPISGCSTRDLVSPHLKRLKEVLLSVKY